MSTDPIGLFDSGVGGTSIWTAIHALLPYENTIYLADSKNAPYGLRPKEEIIALSIKNTDYLLEHHAKIIVVACNTATTNAIAELRARYDVPFIGIEPAIKPAANHSESQTIGILATKGTLSSELFNRAVELYQQVNIIEQVGHGLVELIEEGRIASSEMDALLHQYLDPMVAAGIDHLVLGCSHYPYLIPQIRNIIPAHITIIDSGEAVARQTKKILEERGLLNQNSGTTTNVFHSNRDTKVLSELLGGNYKVCQTDF